MDDATPTLTVTQLNQAARAALRQELGTTVWVRGEIQRLVRSRPGHVYFDLVEKDELRDRVRARVRVALFRDDRRRVEHRLGRDGIELTDDVEVRLAGRVGLYVERGEFQLVMHDVDPTFTTGRLAAERDRLLRTLAQEGLLDANRALPMPPVPLRVGLVSSGQSAAFHDFVEELAASRFAWQVLHADVRVQGNVAPRRLVRAVRALAARPLDVLVLVRGGGSRTDLAAYDAEALARAVAAAPVPVLTGIGHETDRSVVDEVAHGAHRTPTACARSLVEQVAGFLASVERVGERTARSGRTRVAGEQRHLLATAGRLGRAARSAGTIAERDLALRLRRAERSAPATLRRADVRLAERSVALTRTASLRVAAAEASLAARGRRAARAVPRPLVAAEREVERHEARLRALDPRRVLERGYTVTRDEQGRVVRSAAALRPGDRVVTELLDGTVASRVEEP